MPRNNSQNRNIDDTITASRLQWFNQDIDDLYENWDDRLKVFVVWGLEIWIWKGNYRIWDNNWVYSWWTVILDDNTTSYVMLNSGGVVVVSTIWWDENFARLAQVVTLSWSVTSLQNRRQDVVGGVLWGDSWFKNITDMVYNAKQQLTEFNWDWTVYTLTYNVYGQIATISNWAINYTMSYNSMGILTEVIETSI